MSSPIPEFGRAVPGVEYVPRPGGYAVIVNAQGEVALVATPRGLALPGGGLQEGESPEVAAVRETHEESGLRIRIGDRLGVADELLYAAEEKTYYRKRCGFFLAAITARPGAGEVDHELVWLSRHRAAAELRHESQRWAITQAWQQRRCIHD
jgi:8-oxo-dGTP diphosphatase